MKYIRLKQCGFYWEYLHISRCTCAFEYDQICSEINYGLFEFAEADIKSHHTNIGMFAPSRKIEKIGKKQNQESLVSLFMISGCPKK